MRSANAADATFSAPTCEFIRENPSISIRDASKLLILNNGTALALRQDAMKQTADKIESLPQDLLVTAVRSRIHRRAQKYAFIQRVIAHFAAVGSLVNHIFLKQTGENTDELFGVFEVYRPIRPNPVK